MKLLLCPYCYDVFKLAYDVRQCECGRVKGRYLLDGHRAETNGNGINLALDNTQLLPIAGHQLDHPSTQYMEPEYMFRAWVRGHDGPSNPRSSINRGL